MGIYTNASKAELTSPGGAVVAPGAVFDLNDGDLNHPVVKGWLDSKMLVEGDQRKGSDGKELPTVPEFAAVPPIATPLTPDPSAGPGAPAATAATQTQPGAAAAIAAATATSEQNAKNLKEGGADSSTRAAQDQTIVDKLADQKAAAQTAENDAKAKADAEKAKADADTKNKSSK